VDPFVFGIGFFLAAAGLMLSQVHRDERILLPARKGIPFNLVRKVTALAILAAVILGFWIVGLWWMLIAPALVVAAGAAVSALKNSPRRLSAIFLMALTGQFFLFWSQSPTLIELGLLPSIL
jgi:hypothetical protein